jgi:preprotein translocase subunit SecG
MADGAAKGNDMLSGLLTLLLVVVGFFLTFIVLLQRGRGGGVSGALGGLGGQSAFGTKAGDVFTRITVVVAVIWVVLNCASIFANRSQSESRYSGRLGPGTSIEKAPKQESSTPGSGDPALDDPQDVKPPGAVGPADEKVAPKDEPKGEAAPKEKPASKEKAAPAPEAKPAESDEKKPTE